MRTTNIPRHEKYDSLFSNSRIFRQRYRASKYRENCFQESISTALPNWESEIWLERIVFIMFHLYLPLFSFLPCAPIPRPNPGDREILNTDVQRNFFFFLQISKISRNRYYARSNRLKNYLGERYKKNVLVWLREPKSAMFMYLEYTGCVIRLWTFFLLAVHHCAFKVTKCI